MLCLMSWTNVKIISEMSWLPFYDIKYIVTLLFSIFFGVLFFWLLKRLIKDREKKELDTFLKSLDNLNISDEEKRVIKIFTVVYSKFDRDSCFLWFGVEETLSFDDKKLLEDFSDCWKFLPFTSVSFKEFKSMHESEFKIYKSISRKIWLKALLYKLIIVLIFSFLIIFLVWGFSLVICSILK